MSIPSSYPNPCVRCGKQRVDGKTWKEKIENHFGVSFITHTETVCPDKECQKIVEEKMNQARQKTADMKLEKEKKLEAARKNHRTGIKL
ncbi:MAG: hypothetical protein ACM3IJ_03795 [Candidatus Levyibacteriota bacterium]